MIIYRHDLTERFGCAMIVGMKQVAAENEIIRVVNGSKLYGNDHAESWWSK